MRRERGFGQVERLRPGVSFCACILLLALISGCGGSGTVMANPKHGGVATWAELPGDAPNWIFPFVDAAHNNVADTAQFQQLMYRPLYWVGNGGQPSIDYSLSRFHPGPGALAGKTYR
jgi:hypothetical protein